MIVNGLKLKWYGTNAAAGRQISIPSVQCCNFMEDQLLENTQANILISHGRKHVLYLFLRFDPAVSQGALRAWISNQGASGVCSTKDQVEEWEKNIDRKSKDASQIKCFFLAYSGYEKISYPRSKCPRDPSFRLGSRDVAIIRKLGDPSPKTWQSPFDDGVDAAILLADNLKERLMKTGEDLANTFNNENLGTVFFQSGSLLYNAENEEVEPFGFRDGLSNPKFFKDARLIDTDLHLVLNRRDFGSYVVFRKLEQNVKAFNENAEEVRERLGISADFIKAQVVGRWKNGDPLLLVGQGTPRPEDQIDKFNKFSLSDQERIGYEKDRNGTMCPFFSHIRKVNPRSTELQSPRGKNPGIFIVRRGIPYDDRQAGYRNGEDPEKDVGLLFLSYQIGIERQFEHIQSVWCNDPNFPVGYRDRGVGSDPVIGKPEEIAAHNLGWIREWGSGNHMDYHPFSSHISLKGAAYFYAPSIQMLKNLKYGRGG